MNVVEAIERVIREDLLDGYLFSELGDRVFPRVANVLGRDNAPELHREICEALEGNIDAVRDRVLDGLTLEQRKDIAAAEHASAVTTLLLGTVPPRDERLVMMEAVRNNTPFEQVLPKLIELRQNRAD